ncbi:MAG: AmmeMemoRadiSam system protein B [Gemmatales bacterium]|nr:AmmeMemoRadiSam system protein B [Gemmatales bacterium]MDW7995515.1 AmmeMemoRadiSam system protein B [Gemmatales bacterium]
MSTRGLEKPRLRRSVTAVPDERDPRFVWLLDQARVSDRAVRIPLELIPVIEMFNGQRSLRDLQLELMRLSGGTLIPLEWIENLVRQLEEALLLEGDRFREHFAQMVVRPPCCIGVYPPEPERIREHLRRQFQRSGGPGIDPEQVCRNGTRESTLRGALIPHIDYHRGGHSYAWAYKELLEHVDAEVFIILGTAHYSAARFTLTCRNFETPLGIAPADKDYIQLISDYYGDGLFDDEPAHWPEHSIELQVIFLQYCFPNKPFRIVPIVIGSFQDCIEHQQLPEEMPDIAQMIEALKAAERESGARAFYISSGDLAHIGPKFGDAHIINDEWLSHSRQQDHRLLDCLVNADRHAFFQTLLEERDQRRICGFPPTYMLMSVLEPTQGRLLHYDQYVAANGFESVSFASLVFHKDR